jgi:hypothetical protein
VDGIDLGYEPGKWFQLRRSIYLTLRDDVNTLRVWLEIEARAAYQAGWRKDRRGRPIWLDVGQSIVGRPDLMLVLGLSEENVKTALKRLIQLGIITKRGTNRGSIVTLVGYKESRTETPAQPPTAQPAQPPTSHQRATNEPPLTKKGKKEQDLQEEPSPENSGSVSSEPSHDGRRDHDPAHAAPTDERQRAISAIVARVGPAHAKAFAAVKAELGSTAIGPSAMDRFDELRALLETLASLSDAEERCLHVLAVREAEAREKRTLQYFGATMWRRTSFEKALAMEVDDVKKPARGGRVEPMAPEEYAKEVSPWESDEPASIHLGFTGGERQPARPATVKAPTWDEWKATHGETQDSWMRFREELDRERRACG